MAGLTPHDFAMFARVNGEHPKLLEWLKAEDARAIKAMAGRDPILIYRAQGDHARLEGIIDLLTNANKYLRTT